MGIARLMNHFSKLAGSKCDIIVSEYDYQPIKHEV